MITWGRVLAGSMLLMLLLLPAAAPCQARGVQEIRHIELLKTINAARGKVVVVNFFASWCQPCKVEIPGLIKLREKLGEDKLLLLGISVDEDPKALEKFMAQLPFNYPVYLADDDVARVFQVSALPKLLVYNQRGGLAAKHDGFVSEKELFEIMDGLLKQ